MKRSNKGFTLAELLVVIAILAILVGIAIPTFSGATQKANEASDLAAIRGWYAEKSVEVLSEDEKDWPDTDEGEEALNALIEYDDNLTYTYENGTGTIVYEGDYYELSLTLSDQD